MSEILSPKQFEYLYKIQEPKADEFIELRNYALAENIPIADEITMRFIEQLLKIKLPKYILEIGTAIGYSTLRICKNISEKSKLITIEKSKDNSKIAQKNFHKFNYSNKITLIEDEAIDILPKINYKFDFIFLDADKKDYIELFPFLLNILDSGGILIIDNLLWKGRVADSEQVQKENSTVILREFNKIFLSESKLISTILPVGDGIGFAIKV